MKKLLVILGVAATSLSAIFVRLTDAPSMVMVLYRVSLAALILLPFVLIKSRDELKKLARKEVLLSIISGAFLGLHFTFYFESLKYTSIASAVVLVDAEVFFVALLMLVVLKEKISKIGWLGILITFAGSAIIAFADAGSSTNALLGDALSLLGAACVAVYTFIGKLVRKNVSTNVYTFIVYLFAAITVFVIITIKHVPVFGYGKVNYLAALGLVVFCTFLGHSVFSWALKYESAAFISTAKMLEPVYATIMGVFVFAEVPSIMVVLGGLIVIAGVVIYTLLGSRN